MLSRQLRGGCDTCSLYLECRHPDDADAAAGGDDDADDAAGDYYDDDMIESVIGGGGGVGAMDSVDVGAWDGTGGEGYRRGGGGGDGGGGGVGGDNGRWVRRRKQKIGQGCLQTHTPTVKAPTRLFSSRNTNS